MTSSNHANPDSARQLGILRGLFRRVAAARQTPLRFKIDAAEIVAATLHEQTAATSPQDVAAIAQLFVGILARAPVASIVSLCPALKGRVTWVAVKPE